MEVVEGAAAVAHMVVSEYFMVVHGIIALYLNSVALTPCLNQMRYKQFVRLDQTRRNYRT